MKHFAPRMRSPLEHQHVGEDVQQFLVLESRYLLNRKHAGAVKTVFDAEVELPYRLLHRLSQIGWSGVHSQYLRIVHLFDITISPMAAKAETFAVKQDDPTTNVRIQLKLLL